MSGLAFIAAFAVMVPGMKLIFAGVAPCDVDMTPSLSSTCSISSDDSVKGSAMLQHHHFGTHLVKDSATLGDGHGFVPLVGQVITKQYCVILETGGAAHNDGFLEVHVDGVSVASGLFPIKNSVVFFKCYAALVTVTVKNKDNNAWAGSARFSFDHGKNYMAMKCMDCSGGSGPDGVLVVDGNSDGVNQGTAACLDGASCTLQAGQVESQYCVIIETGNAAHNDGFLEVQVDGVSVASGIFNKKSVVLFKCYAALVTVTVKNNNNNAWAGSVRFSSDHGKNYMAMKCMDCTGGSGPDGVLAVDGNSDGVNQGSAACLDGASCTLQMMSNCDSATSTENEQYCITLTTGNAVHNEGTLKAVARVSAASDSLGEWKGSFRQEELILCQCHPEPLTLTVESPTNDAWAGIARFSSDHGVHWMAAKCVNCTGGSGPDGVLAVDGDTDGVNQGSAACLDGALCSLEMTCSGFVCGIHSELKANASSILLHVSRADCCDELCSGHSCSANYSLKADHANIRGNTDAVCCVQDVDGCDFAKQYCIMLTTGSAQHHDGYLEAVARVSAASDSLDVWKGNFSHDELVLCRCHPEPLTLTVKNPTKNGWAGSAHFSSDYGANWMAAKCVDCTAGSGPDGMLVVDGNDDMDWAGSATCLNGTSCSLEMT